MTSPKHTPKFRKPPVVETVISVHFEPLWQFRVVHFGLFWQMLKARFPLFEEEAALPPFLERFGEPLSLPGENAGAWRLVRTPELPRVLFKTRDQAAMIQIQGDRFIHNWARTKTNDPYPSYKANRNQFVDVFSRFSKFVASNRLGMIRPTIAEVTYINRIPIPGNSLENCVRKTFPGFSLQRSDTFLPRVESIFVNESYPIDRSGRLYVHLKGPIRLETREEIIDFRLTALIGPPDPQHAKLSRMIDQAHFWVVNGFKSMTSQAMHEEWEVMT